LMVIKMSGKTIGSTKEGVPKKDTDFHFALAWLTAMAALIVTLGSLD